MAKTDTSVIQFQIEKLKSGLVAHEIGESIRVATPVVKQAMMANTKVIKGGNVYSIEFVNLGIGVWSAKLCTGIQGTYIRKG